MKFEWDTAKNESNIRKHNLDFCDAELVFEKYMLRRLDNRQHYMEERIIALGELDKAVVVVVYTHRGDFIRIISMRRANRHERKIYQDKIQ